MVKNNRMYGKIFICLLTILFPLVTINKITYLNSPDYIIYSNWYNNIGYLDGQQGFEIGFNLIATIFRLYFNSNYILFSFMLMSVSLYLKLLTFNKLKNSYLAIITYCVMLFPHFEAEALRQALALGLLSYLIFYFDKLHKISILILLISSIMIHVISVTLIPIIFFREYLLKYEFKWTAIITIPLVYLVLNRYIGDVEFFSYLNLPEKYGSYFKSESGYTNTFQIPTMLGLLSTLLIPLNTNKALNFYRNVTFIFLSASIIFINVLHVSDRLLDVAYFFSIFWIFNYTEKNAKLVIGIFLTTTVYKFISPYLQYYYN